MRTSSEKEKLGPTIGVIQTGSENHRNPNAPTLIEWTLRMDEKTKESSLYFTKERVQSFRFVF